MAQRKNGSDRAPDHIPVQRRKRKDGRTGRQKSDLDYHLDEAQDRKTAGRKRPEGARRRPHNRITGEEKRERYQQEIGRRKERKAERAGAARGMAFFALQLVASVAFFVAFVLDGYSHYGISSWNRRCPACPARYHADFPTCGAGKRQDHRQGIQFCDDSCPCHRIILSL